MHAACATAEENFELMTMSETPQRDARRAPPLPTAALGDCHRGRRRKVLELAHAKASRCRLRLFVKSGGCSGFSYGLAFDEQLADDDRVELHDGVRS